jgi:hypothetical protein
MNTIRIRKKVDSETLSLPELKGLIGKTVDITIEEAAREAGDTRWADIDRLAEKNAQLYPGPDVGVDIIRQMRDGRHLEGDA